MTTDPTARPTPTPAPVQAEPWELRVLAGGPERWMLDDEADIAKVVDAMVDAGAWQLFELTMDTVDRSPSEAEVRKAAEEVRAALRSAVSPQCGRVAVPDGGWRRGDWFVTRGRRVALCSSDEWRDETGLSLDHEWVERVFVEGVVAYVHAPREDAPRPEPVTAPLPSEAVEALRQVIIDARDQHSYPVDGDDGWEERCRCGLWPPAGVALSADGASLWLWQHQHTAVARAVLNAGYTLPAAHQRARDEGTVSKTNYAVPPGAFLREFLDEVEQGTLFVHPDTRRWAEHVGTDPQWQRWLTGEDALTESATAELVEHTGIDADTWMRYERVYRDDLRRLAALAGRGDEGTVREALVELLAALPPIEHTCFRPQGCVACGRAKERGNARALVIRKLDALGVLDRSR